MGRRKAQPFINIRQLIEYGIELQGKNQGARKMNLRLKNRLAFMAGIAAAFCVSLSPALASEPSENAIEASMQRAMKEFNVPGMAVSVVHDGKLYYAGGAGITETGKKQPVDEKTLFQIASVSKAFTAASLAILVDDGKLGWDDPVIDYLPEFQMFDAWVTREFTIRDLLTHRSGLPIGAGDLLLFPETNTTRDEVVRAMRHLKPGTSFRSRFAYDNLLYIVAGEVVEQVSGDSFEAFLEDRLLSPLGMKDCSATLERARQKAVKAVPHVLVEGELQTTRSLAAPLSAAAGGINCSARGMAVWMMFMLNEGRNSDGEQVISPEQVKELLKPVTITSPRPYFAEHAGSFLSAYALGWGVSTFYGQPMYAHSGGLWGMTSYIALLPKQKLAVFASNNQMSAAPLAVTADLLDRFLSDISPESGKDWISIISEVAGGKKQDAAEVVAKAEAERARDSAPSLPLGAYAGTYRDAWYGDIQISVDENGGLWFNSERSKPLSGPLEHFQYDTFIVRWSTRELNADAYVSFYLSPGGEVERIRMKAVSPATDFSFDFHDLDLVRVRTD